MKAVPEKNGNKTVEIDSRKLSTDDSNVSTPGDKINGISRSMTDPEELKSTYFGFIVTSFYNLWPTKLIKDAILLINFYLFNKFFL